jgi:hypothetical protein
MYRFLILSLLLAPLNAMEKDLPDELQEDPMDLDAPVAQPTADQATDKTIESHVEGDIRITTIIEGPIKTVIREYADEDIAADRRHISTNEYRIRTDETRKVAETDIALEMKKLAKLQASSSGSPDDQLYQALRWGDLTKAQQLVAFSGAVLTKKSCNLLHCAILNGNEDLTIWMLLSWPELLTIAGQTTDSRGDNELCNFFLGTLFTRQTRVARFLLTRFNHLIDCRNHFGRVPLHAAAATGNRELIDFILSQRPAQLTMATGDGRLPSDLALQWRHDDIARYLISRQISLPQVPQPAIPQAQQPQNSDLKRRDRDDDQSERRLADSRASKRRRDSSSSDSSEEKK